MSSIEKVLIKTLKPTMASSLSKHSEEFTENILVKREYVLARPTSVSAYDMHSWQMRGPPGSSRTIKDRCYITEGASQGHGSDQGYA